MKPKRRILSLLLAICLVVGIMPTAAFAANNDKAIQLGASNISGYDSTNGYDYIYYGEWDNSPIKWRVLDEQTNTQNEGLFLLSDVLLGTGTDGGVYFDNSGNNSNVWQKSTAQTWCKNFYSNNFSSKEQNAVLATTKSDSAYTSTSFGYAYGVSSLSGDKVFFLSAEEAENSAYGFTDDNARIANYGNSAGYWWLRSPFANNTINAGLVNIVGNVYYIYVNYDWAARPAFNLDLNSVLFISAAEGGKISAAASGGNQGGEAAGSIFEIGDYTGNEWKLTLKDESRRFSANVNGQTNVSAQAGDSVQITYSGAETGDKEYVSVLLCDSSDTVLYYGNIAQNSESGTATVSLPSGLAAGDYKLKVFSEQCNGDYKTDYASSFQTINLKVPLLETTPNATFTAASDNGGFLSDVDVSMKYSVDGGSTWNGITDTTMAITGVTASNDVKVYKPGNGITTSDSAVQTIDVTQAEPPTGVLAVDCTTSEQNDGQIAGVDSTMEYKLSTASVWTDVPGNSVTGLTNGAYEVRVKANGTALASTAVTVTIAAHTCVAEGDWQYDETNHWKRCSSDSCNAKVDEAAHFEGTTATCTAPAVCDTCHQTYGVINPANHTGKAVWTQTETTHSSAYDCCGMAVTAEEAHEWKDGICSECEYECRHSGGEAYCTEKAVCGICNEEYGKVDASNHKNLVKTEAKPATHLEAGNTEYWYCGDCNKYFSDENGTEETALEDTVIPVTEHTADGAGWHSDAGSHWNTCECGETINKAEHTFKWVIDTEATATQAGSRHEECTVCGYKKDAVEIPETGTTGDPSQPTEKPDATTPTDKEEPSGTNEAPPTGDNSNYLLWIILALASSAGLTGTVIYRRRKKQNR